MGLITKKQKESPKAQDFVIQVWTEVLKDSKYKPIDLQTPLWLWSRNDFKALQSFDDFDIENEIKNSYESNKYLDEFRNRSLTKFEHCMLEKVSTGLPLEANILDLGCGDGYPYDEFFSERDMNLQE